MSKERWCVQDNKGVWCACASNRKVSQSSDNVETLCGEYIVLPYGIENRIPTCPKCINIINKKEYEKVKIETE